MARSASATDIFPCGFEAEPLLHGGELSAARRQFPGAPEPFLDLSTGINPNPYPLPPVYPEAFNRLPEGDSIRSLATVAARAYSAPSAACVVPAPGAQILLPLVAGLVQPGRAAVVAPTYGEFARAAALAGHRVAEVSELAAVGDARLAFVANPNNPDGRLYAKNELFAFGHGLHWRGGVLVVDEAFMDSESPSASLAAEVCHAQIVVLRSFGKFFGLAGMRLGFALAPPPLAARLSALLGPWAVSGPALAVGAKALADAEWIEAARVRLRNAARRLDAILTASQLKIFGGTALFRLVRTPLAGELFDHLGHAGILVRRFEDHADWLRFGLPADEQAWERLRAAMASFRHSD